jgi:flagellar motor switch/type III secretory pathway protein FliN
MAMAEKAIDNPLEGPLPWSRLELLGCGLTVQIPVRAFSVRELLGLTAGVVVDTKWAQVKPVPVHVNGRQVAWCEFEVLAERLGVRITELL